MLSQEELYRCIVDENWSAVINVLYENRKDIISDALLTKAASTFEMEFFKKVRDIPEANQDIIANLENLFIMQKSGFYTLPHENYKSLIVELVKRKPLNEAYNYATLFPDEKICSDTILAFNKLIKAEDMHTPLKPSMQWVQIYNRIFELINDKNDSAIYFSGSRFIKTIKEFQSYFPDYTQYIDLRNSEGKSISRKIYYYDILAELPDDTRASVIYRILEIVRPFKGGKVNAIEVLLGKKNHEIHLDFVDNLSAASDDIESAPVVFISYSWDNDKHKEWVLKLANRLVTNGVNVILDQYDLRLGKNLPHFVETSISRANRILMIFTPNYKLKADKREGGVGYEYSIMNAELYNNQTTNEKIIPVLRSGNMEESIPAFMQQFIHLNITNDANFENSYQDILREIHNEPAIVKPKIGAKPRFN